MCLESLYLRAFLPYSYELPLSGMRKRLFVVCIMLSLGATMAETPGDLVQI
jgi:hypothetical protein